jgi:hypothetical protein
VLGSPANTEEIARRYPKVVRRVDDYNLDEFVIRITVNLAKMWSAQGAGRGAPVSAGALPKIRP